MGMLNVGVWLNSIICAHVCMCELISYSFLLLEVQPMTKEDSLVRMYRMFFQCSSFIQAQTIYIMRNVVKSLL